MLVKFWGTRGGIPAPGPNTIRYGGNTSCVEIRSKSDTLIVLDCGSGLRCLGDKLMENDSKPIRAHILLTHTHWDHIQGLPFFTPLFIPGNEWNFYAPRGFEQSLRETLAGQMQYTYFPVTLEQLGSKIKYHELVEGEFNIDDILIKTQYLNHTVLTLGYRIESNGISIVYSTDHEPKSNLAAIEGVIGEQEMRHAEFLSGADLVMHDSQYTSNEYEEKRGWGHSTVKYAVEICRIANVKKLALTHHDPTRTDDEIDRLVIESQNYLTEKGSTMEVTAAAERQVLVFKESEKKFVDRDLEEPTAIVSTDTAVIDKSVLLGISDPATASILMEAIQANGIEANLKSDGESVLKVVLEEEAPALIILEHDLPGINGIEVCKKVRKSGHAFATEVPIIIVADKEEHVGEGAADGVSDWLSKPFSTLYARTRVHAWLLRSACRWVKPPIPMDEERRLAVLRKLKILDTEPEERFDRITRLASALFDIPVVLISLIDRDRQWFKSCVGVNIREASRERSFCAHVVADRSPIIVPDAFLDDRFADNPDVTGNFRIRFYAGQPLILPDGTCIGTVCLVDTRPRELNEKELSLLKDIGDLVIREIVLPVKD